MLKKDCKHFDEYVDRGNNILTDWCLLHDCFSCDNCTEYEKDEPEFYGNDLSEY